MITKFETIIIFCDGACSGNPGRGGWGSIIVTPDGTVKELGNGATETTNNRMELAAVSNALSEIRNDRRPVGIYTDSTYVIRGITEWIWGWRKRSWKTATGDDVANRDIWEHLADLTSERKTEGQISWHYVRGHTGVPGNERVDEIAVAFSKGKYIELYAGSLLNYGVAIHDIPDDTSLPEMKERVKKKAAHSYLSYVDGKLARHQTWVECERAVKGRSGAKFKKSASAADEAAILAAWGFSIEDL